MITREQFAILCAPFAAADHEFKPPRSYAYIKETALCERIETVDLSWEWRVQSVGRYDPKGLISTTIGHLTICGVTRSGEGSQAAEFQKNSDIESSEIEKGSETDALKRAARKFGIGRYLLECPKDVKGPGPELNRWLASLRSNAIPAPQAQWVAPSDPSRVSGAHWSMDENAMSKMYEWALREHNATRAEVNKIVAKTGKTLLDLEKSEVMTAVKQWAIMQSGDKLPSK